MSTTTITTITTVTTMTTVTIISTITTGTTTGTTGSSSDGRAGGEAGTELSAARPSALAARPSCPMASAVARRITGAAVDRSASLFRGEALRFRAEDLRHEDPAGSRRLVPVSPRWTARTYWVLLALVAAGLLGSAQMRVGEFARGPAVVRDRWWWRYCLLPSRLSCGPAYRSS